MRYLIHKVADYKSLLLLTKEIFSKVLPEKEAEIIADTLVEADLQGVESHGVQRIKGYLERYEKGIIENQTIIDILEDTMTTVVIDANNGWGQVAAVEATNITIEKAEKYGSAYTGVRNSNHYGMAAYYTRMIAKKGFIGITTTNASPFMVPYGSAEPSLGANPLSISIPTGEDKEPIILDMSASNVARGKIMLAKQNNEEIPKDWAITHDGKQTTNPHEAWEGYLLPLGPKGSGLAIIIDILSGVLTGSLFGKQIPKQYEDPYPQRIGHLFGAIKIENFIDLDVFYENVQQKINETVNSQPMEGFNQVRMPGDSKIKNRNLRMKDGIPLSEKTFFEIIEVGEKYGIKVTDYI